MVRMNALLRLLLPALLAGCTASGIAGDPVSRTFQWFDVMAGNDIRRACAPGAPERWRFVYNGIYSEQIRTYDIAGGTMETRIFVRPGFGYLGTPRPDELMNGARSAMSIAPEDLEHLVRVWESDLPNAVKPIGHLRSDRFFWTTAACRNGRFQVAAFTYPPDASAPFGFPQELFRFDRSGKAVNPPRPMRDVGALTDFIPSRHNSDDNARFLLKVTPDGIEPGY
jgi:hypothetical protein